MKPSVKIVVTLAIGLSLGLGLGYLKLRQERGASARKILDLEQKSALLQKRYSEQKALEGQLMRAKAMLEGQKRSVQSEMEKIEEEKKALLAEKDRLSDQVKALQARVSGLEEKLQNSEKRYAALKTEKEDLEKQRQKDLADHKNELARIDAARKEAESELRAALSEREQMLNQCVSHNQKLSATARELLDRYEGKSVFGSLLQKEPFTQIRKVEIENLIDEYKSRIEEGTLEKKGKKR